MRKMFCFLCVLGASLTLLVAGSKAFGNEEKVIAPGKFIPTFAIKYGSVKGWPSAEEAAKFDLIDTSVHHYKVHASKHGNTWQTLKYLNPNIIIVLYKNGPALYNTASWGQLGEGWDWIKEHHGKGSSDRWTAVGLRHNGYLQRKPYPNERLMYLGNRNWQKFWVHQSFAKFFSGAEPKGAGADGIFADNTQYKVPPGWYLEGQPDKEDLPKDYYRDGTYRPELFKADMKYFFSWTVPWLKQRGRVLVPNFGGMAREPQTWQELDSEPHPPFAAMEEGAFVHPWGTLGRQGNFVFWNEKEWLNQVNTMRKLKNVCVLMSVHGPVISDADDICRMNAEDASGNRPWDVLWYAMTSFLQGFDDVRRNAYMNFTVWSYWRFYWFDEFDPAYLHLGRARGEFSRVEGTTGHIYIREFDDGWSVVNPTKVDAEGIAVPGGTKARVLNHDSFKQPENQPMVTTFDLPSHQGVILLQARKKIGNQDNR